MHERNSQILSRLTQFARRLLTFRPDRREVIFLTGWTVSLVLLFWPVPVLINPISFVLFFFFWFKLTDIGYRKLQPPGETLFLVFFALFAVFALVQPENPLAIGDTLFLRVYNLLLHGLLIIIFSLLLVTSERGKKGGLIAYSLLFYIGLNVWQSDASIYLVLLQTILFLVALRRTVWLETLTKKEIYIYFVAVVFLFRLFLEFEPFPDYQGGLSENSYIWLGLPKFLYYVFLMYLLAVLVKTPIVLVYNFATLSRKLRIASFFQSTFPQITQLVMLVIIFYFVLAGWQAEKARQAMVGEMHKVVAGRLSPDMLTFTSSRDDLPASLLSQGYQPVRFDRPLPEYGVLAVRRNPRLHAGGVSETKADFFLFAKKPDNEAQIVHFARLDSIFLQHISDHTSILFGTHLRVAPYEPPPWESVILGFDLFTTNKLRISPFGLLPSREKAALQVAMRQEVERSGLSLPTDDQKMPGSGMAMTVGRVIAPLLDGDKPETGFFVMEIVLVPGGGTFLTPTLLSYVLLLGLGYALVNMLVIRRMTRFGSEINRIIVQKFDHLRRGIQEISAGNLDYRLHIEGKDEFVELADHFNEMGGRLKKSMEATREKERLEQELAIARKVQLALLPKNLPDIPGFEIAATLQTANEVGGDFYDVIPLTTSRFLVTIGDVSGKGTSAALYMAQCVSLIRYSCQFSTDPREMAIRLNHYFANPNIDRQMFVTAIIGVLDAEKNTFEFVRAGHLPPLFVGRDGQSASKEIASSGLGLGLEAGKAFTEVLQLRSVQFQENDILVLFTDGVVEAARSQKEPDAMRRPEMGAYGEARLRRLLESMRAQPAVAIERAVKRDISAFYERAPYVDDYTVLILKKKAHTRDGTHKAIAQS
jgi:serine phosphatase RsbU (regulator of sigma subunit)